MSCQVPYRCLRRSRSQTVPPRPVLNGYLPSRNTGPVPKPYAVCPALPPRPSGRAPRLRALRQQRPRHRPLLVRQVSPPMNRDHSQPKIHSRHTPSANKVTATGWRDKGGARPERGTRRRNPSSRVKRHEAILRLTPSHVAGAVAGERAPLAKATGQFADSARGGLLPFFRRAMAGQPAASALRCPGCRGPTWPSMAPQRAASLSVGGVRGHVGFGYR